MRDSYIGFACSWCNVGWRVVQRGLQTTSSKSKLSRGSPFEQCCFIINRIWEKAIPQFMNQNANSTTLMVVVFLWIIHLRLRYDSFFQVEFATSQWQHNSPRFLVWAWNSSWLSLWATHHKVTLKFWFMNCLLSWGDINWRLERQSSSTNTTTPF